MSEKLQVTPLRFVLEIVVAGIVFMLASGVLGLAFAFTYYGWSEETRAMISDPANREMLKIPTFFVIPFVMFATFAVIEAFMRLRNTGFKALGLRRPENWPLTFLRGVGLACGIYLLSLGIQYVMAQFGETVNLNSFDIMRDDPLIYAYGIFAVAWFAAGFVEEGFFRGYLMNHLAYFFGGDKRAIIGAVFLQALVFAGLHFDQDWAGVIPVFMVGLTLGSAYYLFGRNLWPLIIAHALIDSTSFTLLYLGIIH